MTSQFKFMEAEFHAAARKELLRGVELLPPEAQRMFRLMYARREGKRSVEDAVVMPLAHVVSEIPIANLDWAMQQVAESQKS